MNRLSRRQFMVGVGVAGLGLLVGCGRLPWQAEPPAKVPQIGWLGSGPEGNDAAFRQGLVEHGYVDGQNIVVVWRGSLPIDQLPDAAHELVHLGVEIIVTGSTPAALAAKGATSTIPIVMGTSFRPVELG